MPIIPRTSPEELYVPRLSVENLFAGSSVLSPYLCWFEGPLPSNAISLLGMHLFLVVHGNLLLVIIVSMTFYGDYASFFIRFLFELIFSLHG